MKTSPKNSSRRILPLMLLAFAVIMVGIAACEAGSNMSDEERRRAEEQNARDAWGSYRNQ